VLTQPAFLRANPGFAYDYQFVDVPEYMVRPSAECKLKPYISAQSKRTWLCFVASALAPDQHQIEIACIGSVPILQSHCSAQYSWGCKAALPWSCETCEDCRATLHHQQTANPAQGRGESEPVPHFYQNLGEAEYLVSVFQYMRLLGYPAEKISILTTYNGQKALLRDVIELRCAQHPAFGRPHKVCWCRFA